MRAIREPEREHRVLIGRQPILDGELKTRGYELLFRPLPGFEADFNDGEKATAQVINNALVEIGLENLVGNDLAYINFTRAFLVNDVALLLPPAKVVLEVLENVEVDQSLIDGIRKLAAAGFQIALDDFQYHPRWEPLLELASIIKFDVRALGVDAVAEQLQRLPSRDIILLAEKVETREEYQQYRNLGFHYFQGYFFAKPELISSKALPDDRLGLLNLIARLQDSSIEIAEIEQLVSQNASLSYRLFRYINSAAFALPREIDSIRQVVIYFGLQRLKNWTSLMAMTNVGGTSRELLLTGLVRAKFCELLALALQRDEPERYFMLGLFSILDALMGSSMAAVLDRLPITEEVARALLVQDGELGEILRCVMACEDAEGRDVALSGVDALRINRLYMDALLWSRQAMAGLA